MISPVLRKAVFFHTAIFIGSFLLFEIQPIVSKIILPLFGGSYLVWATCLVFFQTFLLLGYLYAHTGQKILGVSNWAKVHIFLLLLPLVFPMDLGEPAGEFLNFPLPAAVFLILLFKVGFPFLLLSAGSVIIQSWYYVSNPEQEGPYFLYGASNLGSLIALVTYPFLVEPLLPLGSQILVWKGLYFALIVSYLLCFPYHPRFELLSDFKESPPLKERKKIAVWFFLAMGPSCLLTSTTNIITFDIAVVPLLWIIPLGVYILTFILTFRRNARFPKRADDIFRWALSLGMIFYLLSCLHLALPAALLIAVSLLILFVVAFTSHSRLFSLKPVHGSTLTLFYVVIALGGICGSFTAGIIMPLVTETLLEYPFSLFIAALAFALATPKKEDLKPLSLRNVFFVVSGVIFLLLILLRLLNIFSLFSEKTVFLFSGITLFIILRYLSRSFRFLSVTMFCVLIIFPWIDNLVIEGRPVVRFRNFYGIYRIYDKEGQRFLQHGSVLHGRQYLDERSCLPAGYYHSSAPAGEIITSPDFTFQDIAMIGLGSGALLAHFKDGQRVSVYELDPDSLLVAEKYFSYIDCSKHLGVKLRTEICDGRIALKECKDNSYDLLIIDAFNSDSIPVHLLTLEAHKEYLRVLKPQGLVLMHISNEKVNLLPVLYSAASFFNIYACDKANYLNRPEEADFSQWMVLTPDQDCYEKLTRKFRWIDRSSGNTLKITPWRDDYVNILPVLFRK